MKRLPIILPRSHRRARNALQDLALGKINVIVISGEYGLGKSALLEWAAAKFSWEFPLHYYVSRILDPPLDPRYDLDKALEHARKLGLVDDGNLELVARRLRNHFLALDDTPSFRSPYQRRDVEGRVLVVWLNEIAQRLGRPRPDPLACLPLMGFVEEPKGRYPILVHCEPGDTPGFQDTKVLTAMGLSVPRGQAFTRHSYLRTVLEAVPCMLLFDEADLLEADTIHSARTLADITGTPICLAGGKRLENRLLTDPRLRALMTRIGANIQLTKPTAADLSAALLDLDSRVVMALWRAGQENFRIISLILASLSRLSEANPGLRLTTRSVEEAAKEVLGAGSIHRGSGRHETSEDDLVLDVPQAAQVRAPIKRIPVQARKVAQATG